MFDISLGEIVVIGAVALVVIGPEKLPRVARTAGLLFGRAQRIVAAFHADLERELHFNEITELQKKIIENTEYFNSDTVSYSENIQPDIENLVVPPVEKPFIGEVTIKPRKIRSKKPEKATVSEPTSVKSKPAIKPRQRKKIELQTDLFVTLPSVMQQDTGDRR